MVHSLDVTHLSGHSALNVYLSLVLDRSNVFLGTSTEEIINAVTR